MARTTAAQKLLEPLQNLTDDMKAMRDKLLNDALSTETLVTTFIKIDELSKSSMRTIGAGAESAARISKGIADSMDGIQKLGYTVDLALETAQKMTETLSVNTGRNMTYSKELFGKIQATVDVTGISAEKLTKNFINVGFSLDSVSEKTGKALDVARASGLNGKDVSEKMVNNLSMMDKFTFQGGIDGLAKMAAFSVQMRVGMAETFTLAEKLLNPESAIETAAALQRLGVVQSDLLDPMRLMNMSQNDPAELQKQIAEMTKGFTKLNDAGQMEILPGGRERLQAISKELNISYTDLTNMARSGVELESKLKGIKFPEMATEEQKMLISNMAHLDKNGEYKISVNGVDKSMDEFMAESSKNGKFNEDMLKELEEANTPKTIESLAKEQLDVSKQMLARLGGVGAKAVLGKATSDSTKGASDFSKQMYDRLGKIMDALEGDTSTARDNRNKFSTKPIPDDEDLRKMGETFPPTIPFNIRAGQQEIQTQVGDLSPDSPLKPTFTALSETMSGVDDALQGFIQGTISTMQGDDFIRTEDGNISFFEKDTIIAGTGLNDIAKMIKGDISPTSNRMETSPLQSIGASTKDLENMTKNSVTNGSSNENKLVIEVRVSTSNDNINPDLNQKIVDVVTQAFKDDMGLKQVVATSIKDVVTNGSRPS